MGPDRIGELEHAVVDSFWNLVGLIVPSMKAEDRVPLEVEAVEAELRESGPTNGNGHKHKEEASTCTNNRSTWNVWTDVLLQAYGLNCSLRTECTSP